MCPGMPEDKADKLFDICVGPNVDYELNMFSESKDDEARRKILEAQ